MRELAVQSANDSNTDSDREEIQKEMNELTSEVNRIAKSTEFNTGKLLDGSRSNNSSAPLPEALLLILRAETVTGLAQRRAALKQKASRRCLSQHRLRMVFTAL
jgi:flagellin-like hook-associated protein FlgL